MAHMKASELVIAINNVNDVMEKIFEKDIALIIKDTITKDKILRK